MRTSEYLNTTQKVYTDAQNYCERLFPTGLSGSGRVPCIEDYVARNQLKESPSMMRYINSISFHLSGRLILLDGVL
jgi:hypothetical protein